MATKKVEGIDYIGKDRIKREGEPDTKAYELNLDKILNDGITKDLVSTGMGKLPRDGR